jgi:putative oxidoreductase
VTEIDIAAVLLRGIAAIVMFAHGYNHVFRGGKLAGTARWFESIGIRPGRVHAALASYTELGCAVLLTLGLLTPLAAAGVSGTMAVALIANHRKNGFFIFRPGEGYEYVLTLVCVGLAIGALGGGRVSLDNAFDIDWSGWGGFATTAGAGLGGAALLLITCWRPVPKET